VMFEHALLLCTGNRLGFQANTLWWSQELCWPELRNTASWESRLVRVLHYLAHMSALLSGSSGLSHEIETG
jgi:hypothetical protein